MRYWFVLVLCLIAGCGKSSLEAVVPTMRPGDAVIVSDKAGGHFLVAKTERELERASKMLDDDDDRIARMLDDGRAELVSGRSSATLLSNNGKYFQLDIEILDSDFKPFTYRGYVFKSEANLVAATPELSAAVSKEFEATRTRKRIDAKREALNPGEPGDAVNVTGQFNKFWTIEDRSKGSVFPHNTHLHGTRHGVFLALADGIAHVIIDIAKDGEPSKIVEGHVRFTDVIIEKDEIPLSDALKQAKIAFENKKVDE